MAMSMQSMLRSSRVQMVPEDSMVVVLKTDDLGERGSSGTYFISMIYGLEFAQVEIQQASRSKVRTAGRSKALVAILQGWES